MKIGSSKASRFLGTLMLGIGAVGTIYFAYATYMWFAMTELLYFLTPAYDGLVTAITLLAGSIGFAWLGYKLIKRPRGPLEKMD
jgi:peptidoglycan/LPS O-acetylase OafA/YrhL